MTASFQEVQDVMPKNAFMIMVFVLVATDAFILLCYLARITDAGIWVFLVTSAVFGGIILFCWLVKLRISMDDDLIRIRFLKLYTIRFEEVIDHKVGDVSIIRNYSGWGIKKVTFKNLICVGYDRGISLKLTGRRVFTFSASDPEMLASLLPPPQTD